MLSRNNNNGSFIVGPPFSSKIHFKLKILSRIPNRDFEKITISPHGQNSNSKTKIKAFGEEVKPLHEYKNAVRVFDDTLGSSNSKYIDQSFIKVAHNNLDIYYLSQSLFYLPKRTIKNKSNKKLLFNQTMKDIENLYRDVIG